jgi:hypothetical protein
MDAKIPILIILFLTCALYSIILEQIHDRYVPRYLWLTVVVGNALVWGSLWLMELYGVELTALIVLEANMAGGLPVIAWQLHQNYRRSKEMHQP